jgi:DNA-binding transcriptional MocR family regulator
VSLAPQPDQTDQSNQPIQTDQWFDLALDLGATTPLYRQIADQLVAHITSGALPAGTRLPPTRLYATRLQTHRNTVVRAFDELARHGWIASHVGRGSFVREAPGLPLGPGPDTDPFDPEGEDGELRPEPEAPRRRAADERAAMPWSRLRSRAIESEPLLRMQRLSAPPADADTINLARMQASLDLMPHEDFRVCMDHVLRSLGPEALSYAPSQGLERLRVQIANELGRTGIACSPDEILITSGSQQALDLIARGLVDPGDAFVTEGRTYSGALNILTISGAEVLAVPGDAEGPEIGALEALSARRIPVVKGVYLMPNSRNPTGTSISARRRVELVAWSREASVPLIEDDYGADLILDPAAPPLPALRALDPEVFHVSTFSKKLIPALRVGFIVCPPTMRGPLTRMKHAMDLGTSAVLQHALAEFLERGLMAPHIAKVTAAYRERRDALVGALRAYLPDAIEYEVPSRGVVLWLSLGDLDPEVVYEAAREHGVVVSPGSVYSLGAVTPNASRSDAAKGASAAGLRLAFCAEPPARLVEGARRLGKAMDKLLSRRYSARRTELFGA